MWPFMLVGSVFALAAATSQPRTPDRVAWVAAFLLLVLFVGLRHHVGMDWNNYLRMIDKVNYIQYWKQLSSISEPGYALLLVIGHNSGGGIYVTNLIGASIFCFGLFICAGRTREPWLALMAALPFLVVAFSMSANRQAVAVGLLLILIAKWEDWGLCRKVAFILLASLFHTSAVIMLGFIGTSLRIPFLLKCILVFFFTASALYLLQVAGKVEYYDGAYGRGQTSITQSSGALIHVALNAVPASLYLFWPRYRAILFPTQLLRHMAIAAIITFPLAIVMSVAAGRISLYWYPISMFVVAALPQVVTPNSQKLMRGLITSILFIEMAIWLMFANSSGAHTPYRNAIFESDYNLHIGIVR